MEKTEKILDIIAHPGRYSDKEIESVLDNEESRKLYNTMVETSMATDTGKFQIDVDAEWRRFAAAHSAAGSARTGFFAAHRSLARVAAVFAGAAILSGVSFAAYHYVNTVLPARKAQTTAAAKDAAAEPPTAAGDTAKVAAVAKAPVKTTFINATLASMLGEIAAYYNARTVFKSESAKKLRLYYTWDSAKGLNRTVAELNRFENVNITLNDNTITVE